MGRPVTFIYDYFHPAYKAGGPIRSLLNLADSIGADIPVSVVCSNVDHDGSRLNVVPDKWLNAGPYRIYYNSRGFGALKKILPDQAVVYINGVYSLVYNFLPAVALNGRKIISARGMLHPEGLKQKRFKKRVYLWLWRALGIHKRCEFHATDDRERQFIQAVFGYKVKVWVIPNMPNQRQYAAPSPKVPGELRILTVALIGTMKNHLSVLQALSICRFNVTYNIYGPVKEERYWKACLNVIGQLPSNIRVNYHGEADPGSIDEILAENHVYIQPSLSENFGHSLYEALAKGRPVITSEATPWNNLELARAGINVPSSDNNRLEKAIAHFAEMDQNTLSEWSLAARSYAESAMDVWQVHRQYLEMFSEQPCTG